MSTIPTKWQGGSPDYAWTLEVEHDCFSPDEPFVVSIATDNVEDGRSTGETLATATPEQAREMAAALLAYADMADAANERIASAERSGGR